MKPYESATIAFYVNLWLFICLQSQQIYWRTFQYLIAEDILNNFYDYFFLSLNQALFKIVFIINLDIIVSGISY